MRTRAALLVLVVVGAVVTACGTQSPGADAAPTRSTATPTAAGTDAKAGSGTEATPAQASATLGFTADTLDGDTFDGRSLAGRPAVLWFWAPWCPTCVGQAPTVTKLAETYDGKVNVVGVAGLDQAAAMEEFVTRTGVQGMRHLSDEKGAVWKRFGVTAQSTFVLLDADGEVAFKGYLEPSDLASRVDALTG
ncbi:redoxin family protein [Actinopolymorpha sp. B17G11]|uniref:TlpA family protein disulfide reductase n=1 Tax=Actinopolymorpha sp. B17G11 TaxID=3160861 RepID=UPI0032E3A8A7